MDKDIKISREHPEAQIKHIVQGIVRKGLKPVPPKASISLRVDRDVLEWFRNQGAGYQSRMNAVLKAFKEASAGKSQEIPVLKQEKYKVKAPNVWPDHIIKLAGAWKDLPAAEEIFKNRRMKSIKLKEVRIK